MTARVFELITSDPTIANPDGYYREHGRYQEDPDADFALDEPRDDGWYVIDGDLNLRRIVALVHAAGVAEGIRQALEVAKRAAAGEDFEEANLG